MTIEEGAPNGNGRLTLDASILIQWNWHGSGLRVVKAWNEIQFIPVSEQIEQIVLYALVDLFQCY